MHRFKDLVHKESFCEEIPFVRLRISVKSEIVTMREPLAKPSEAVGTYVEPQEWNTLISDPDVTLIDTRNDYEYRMGTFKGAMDPNTKTFCQFGDYVKNQDFDKKKKIAMFCTGGIRCEKASSFMKLNGYENVYHLKGGILKYLETVPKDQSLWDGECYVFDKRVAVGQDLVPGSYISCFACRAPLSREDAALEHYMEGIQCPYCYENTSQKSRNRSIERQRQVELSMKSSDTHIGKTWTKKRKIVSEEEVAGTDKKDEGGGSHPDVEALKDLPKAAV